MSNQTNDRRNPVGPWEYFPAQNYEGFAIAPRGRLPTLAAVERKGSITVFNYPDATEAHARLIAAAPELLAVLHEGRRAIGDHSAPNDCYATGPLTGDAIRDLVQCPACSFIAAYDAVVAKATLTALEKTP